jgi:cytidylate kinase
MKEDLLNYMNQRSQKLSKVSTIGGPVVTISREKGCPANSIAAKLSQRLSKHKKEKDWSWVNKAIIEESAKELHMNPSKINHVLYSEDKGFFRDLILSFGEKYYQSDVKVKKTLAELIGSFSRKGHVIIVGLGGVAITKGIEKSLHIKLHAPYKYRLQNVMKMEEMISEEARDYMEEADVNRKLLIDYFNGIKAGSDLFHAHFNCSLLSEEEIVTAIVNMMELKGLI